MNCPLCLKCILSDAQKAAMWRFMDDQVRAEWLHMLMCMRALVIWQAVQLCSMIHAAQPCPLM
jgi:hypothetical protein